MELFPPRVRHEESKRVYGMLRWGSVWFCTASSMLSKLAQRQWLSVMLMGLLAFGGSAAITLLVGIPEPRINDEFSYLLAADTFAHGRLSNPPHPMWHHFESMHIIHQPTYASKYPPAQGLMLAAGQVISGYPIVGVWLSVGLMCAAICWMLYAWLPPRWAVWGGLLAVIRLGMLGDWAQSYWGGAVAAAGGALVFGALRRIMNRPGWRDAFLMGLGLAILANSRPYEGLLVSVPVGVVLGGWLVSKHGPALRASMQHIVLPITAMLALTAVGMGFYNLRVTGHVLRMPYQVHEAMYGVAPVFLWQKSRPEPTYRHQVLQDIHLGWELNTYNNEHPLGGSSFRAIKISQFNCLWSFYLEHGFALPLLMLPWLLRNRWIVFALLTCCLLGVGLLVATWALPVYVAPITGLIFAIVLQGNQLWQSRDRATGQFVVWIFSLISVLSLVWTLGHQIRSNPASPWYIQRAGILKQLKQAGGQHLVIVRYGAQHVVHNEWVYNEADIDHAAVVWARDMDTAQNRELVEYFKDRHVWLLDVWDQSIPTLRPYTAYMPQY